MVILKASDVYPKNRTKKQIFKETTKITAENFKLKKGKNGVENSILEIALPNGKFYKYYLRHKSTLTYYCINCSNKKSTVAAKLCKDEENDEFYVILSETPHSCNGIEKPKLFIFDPQTTNAVEDIPADRIIEKANFELSKSKSGKENGIMEIIMLNGKLYKYYKGSNSNYYCIKCQNRGKIVGAKLCKDKGNKESFVLLGHKQHVCQPQTNNEDQTLQTTKLFPKTKLFSNFVLFPSLKGIPNSKMIIFNPNDFTKGYDYFLNEGSFKCNACVLKNKRVTAKLIENENGEGEKQHSLELGHREHICGYRNLSEQKRIFKVRKIVEENPKEIIVPYFADKKFCYKFILNENLQVFYCKNCKKDGKSVWAKIIKNQKDQTFLVLSSKHQCSPILSSEIFD